MGQIQRPAGFHWVEHPEPHRARTVKVLADHPEIRALFGRSPWSLAIIVAIVLLQLALAVLLRHAPWWLIALVAFAVGAFADHALFVMIHECTHNLLFRRTAANRWSAILANLPSIAPSAISFAKFHLKHHRHQGAYDLDADIPCDWEAAIVGRTAVGKACWLAFFPIFQGLRLMRFAKTIPFWDRWVTTNVLVQIAFDALVAALLGWNAFAYLLASTFFSVGLHPVGARWIQEHYLVYPDQETCSYYGAANLVAFNVGFHNEHHDFPNVPWNRLPRIKAIAREHYDPLHHHTSWSRLLLRFLLDPELSLWSRATRKPRSAPSMGAVAESHAVAAAK
jgi:sphingolipid delta-4 desaturase